MLIATFYLNFDAVALGNAFEDVPDMTVEAERIAAHGTEWTMPCMWVSADDFDAVDDALAGDPSVDRIIETDEFETEKYYHLDWGDQVHERIDAFVDHEGSILRADASGDGWEMEFRFVNRDQFEAFRATLQDRGRDFELLEIYEPGTPRQTTAGLTPTQRDALVAAVERGYFEIPRETAMQELADELEMSLQALSELLRRGMENLVTAILRMTTADDSSLTDSDTENPDSSRNTRNLPRGNLWSDERMGAPGSRDPRAVLDEIAGVLADAHRRYVISLLVGREGSLTRGDFTRNICSEGIASSDGIPLNADRVYAILYHSHLPKLARANCIAFDTEEKAVSGGDRFHECSAPLGKLQS